MWSFWFPEPLFLAVFRFRKVHFLEHASFNNQCRAAFCGEARTDFIARRVALKSDISESLLCCLSHTGAGRGYTSEFHYFPLAPLHLSISVSVGTRPRFANSILASFLIAASSIRWWVSNLRSAWSADTLLSIKIEGREAMGCDDSRQSARHDDRLTRRPAFTCIRWASLAAF